MGAREKRNQDPVSTDARSCTAYWPASAHAIADSLHFLVVDLVADTLSDEEQAAGMLSAKNAQRDTAILLGRQRQLLALLHAFGGHERNLDFQKLLFLYCQEPDAAGAYEFVPYKYGAFSFTSCADRLDSGRRKPGATGLHVPSCYFSLAGL